MSKGALYEFNNPDQLKIPLPHKHIASTFNDIMSKDNLLDSDVGCYTYGIADVYGYPLCVLRNRQVITHTEQR